MNEQQQVTVDISGASIYVIGNEGEEVAIGPTGIHVKDGDEEVNVTFSGIRIRDGQHQPDHQYLEASAGLCGCDTGLGRSPDRRDRGDR